MKKGFLRHLEVMMLLVLFMLLTDLSCKVTKIQKDLEKREAERKTEKVKVTMYTTVRSQTDDTPFVTASGFRLNKANPAKHRVVAISRDLKAQLKFGDRVKLEGIGKYSGIYRVEDLMNRRFTKRVDILINPEDQPTSFDNAKMIIL